MFLFLFYNPGWQEKREKLTCEKIPRRHRDKRRIQLMTHTYTLYVRTSKPNAFGLPARGDRISPTLFRIPSQACWDHCTKSAAASSTDAVHGELLLKLSSSCVFFFVVPNPASPSKTSLVPGGGGQSSKFWSWCCYWQAVSKYYPVIAEIRSPH